MTALLLSPKTTSPKLREYQQQVVAEVHQAIASGKRRPLIVMPTGSGKTVIAAQLINDFIAQGLRVLFIVHLDCLVPQTAEKLESFGISHGFIKAGYSEDRDAPVQIASCQTLPRRHWWKEHHFDVLIYDECHKTGWTKISRQLIDEYYPKSIHLGMTATPFRLSKHEGMADVFDCLIQAPAPAELMQMGYLVSPVYYSLPQADLQAVRTVAGDYSEADLGVVCNQPELVDKLVMEWHRLAQGQRTIAFAVNVSHARAIADGFTRAGVPAASVDGSTPIPERNRLYQKLAAGELLVLSSCSVLVEGFDSPNVGAVIMARPTKSKALYFQQLGRGLRPADGKDCCIVLDQAGNVRRFGFVEDVKRFTLTKGSDRHAGEMPMKECPECSAYLRTFDMKCKHCGYSYPLPPKIQQTGHLEQLSPKKAPGLDLTRLWEGVLLLVQPFSTQVFFRQQCTLQTFDGRTARVICKSPVMFRLIRDRLPALESAFERLFKRPVRCTLEVLEQQPVQPSLQAKPDPQPPSNLAKLDELFRIQKSRNYKPGWVAHQFLELRPSLDELKVCAKRLGYHWRWAVRQYEQLQRQKGAIA